MRYDTAVFFQHRVPGDYDPETGDYGDDIIYEDEVPASVYDTTLAEKTLIDAARVGEDMKTVHIQNHYFKPFDHIRIGDDVYRVESRQSARRKQIFVLSKVVRK